MDLYKVPRASLGHEGGSVIRGREGKVSVCDTPQLPEPPQVLSPVIKPGSSP